MKKIFGVVFLIIAISFLPGCQKKYDANYVGLFYPRGASALDFLESPPFDSLEQCINWIDETEDRLVSAGKADESLDYECQKDCTLGDKYYQGVKYTCQESVY